MRINRTRYTNAKKQLRKLLKYRRVVEAWDNAVNDCPFREHVTAVDISEDGVVKLECETVSQGEPATK